MDKNLLGILSLLLTSDLSIYFCVKGKVVEKNGKIRNNKLLKWLLTEHGRKTNIHFSILICNVILCFTNCINSILNMADANKTKISLSVIKNYFSNVLENKTNLIIELVLIIVLTLIFMLLTYRSSELRDDEDVNGNRILTTKEIDKEYISFSFPDNIDSGSTLLLIAGDLSFFGNVPEIKNLNNNKKKQCQKYLSDNSPNHQCCNKNTKFCNKNLCMEKSKQFEQLFNLINKGVKIRIICKKPIDIGDLQYKRRIGRLKLVYGDSISIKFLPEDTLGNGICVLGRIKSNGGIKELFWHWKVPGKPGFYTVPETLKDITSENKTIIFLLKDVLWEYAKSNDDIIKNSIDEYKNFIK